MSRKKRNKKLQLIQVGMGKIAGAWIKAVLASPDVEFAGFVEVDQQAAAEKAALFSLDPGRIYPSLPEALAATRADGVINLTPPGLHREIAFLALEAGLPVLSEKPLADTLPAAEAIVRRAEAVGLPLMVAQNYRYKAPQQTVKNVLAGGELGRVGGVAVSFYKGPNLPGFHQTLRYPLLVDMAIHHFDLLRFFVDAEPVSVFGRSWNPPWSWLAGDASAAVIFEFPEKVLATYDASWVSTGLDTSWNGNWRFACERGVVVLQDDEVYVQQLTDVPTMEGGYAHFETTPLEKVPLVELPRSDQAYLLHEFYEAVTRGAAPATSGRDNLKSLKMVFAAIQSFETGESVRVEA
jgi:predicted dehydrogenase